MMDDDILKVADRDTETGHFIKGKKGGPGRPRGSRARLGEDFLADLHDAWQEHGEAALTKVATGDPTAFVKVVANVLPREVLLKALSVNATVDLSTMEEAKGFLEAYRYARDRIGAVPLEGVAVTEAWRAEDD